MLPPIAILAGGRATRLGELATSIPKSMIPVCGKPFIEHQLRRLKQEGIHRVVLCVGHLGEVLKDFLKDGSALGLEIEYSEDGEHFLGTGGAILQALPKLGPIFFVTYGDTLLTVSYSQLASQMNASAAVGVMAVLRNENHWDRSNIWFEGGQILRYDKIAPTTQMKHIDYGLSIFRQEAFSDFPPGAKFDLGDVFQKWIPEGRLQGFEVTRRFYEIGTPGSLKETEAHLRQETDRS